MIFISFRFLGGFLRVGGCVPASWVYFDTGETEQAVARKQAKDKYRKMTQKALILGHRLKMTKTQSLKQNIVLHEIIFYIFRWDKLDQYI